MAANLAAKGFVVLAYDPVGLGERVQSYDRTARKRIAGCCADEHLHAGAQSMLIGESVARYFIHDAIRGIDYLVSRPEVDAERIGAAGCSGGGCVTTYVAALDPRVKAAAPACFINTLRVLFTGPYPDSEMSLPRFIASGLDHADFIAVSNRMPWLILATEGDFFTPAGVHPVYREARRWYGLFGAEDKVQLFMGPGKHGTPLETREQLYAFLIRWLQPESKADPREGDIPLYADHELQVTGAGQVEFEEGSRWLYQVIRDGYESRKQPRGLRELIVELRRLGVPSNGQPPPVTVVQQNRDRVRLLLESEPGVSLGATLYLPDSPGRKPAMLLVQDAGTSQVAEAATGNGTVVLELEPRDSPKANDKRPFLGNWMTNMRADSIGRNLPALRAHDILRGVDYLRTRDDVDSSHIRGMARGVDGVWLLLAAAAEARINEIWLDRTPHSLRASLNGPIHTRLFDAVIPGFLQHWDLADLVRAMGKRPVMWTDPADWMGKTVPGLGAAFRYRGAGHSDEALLAEFLN
jgi:dienelactone hydrolase